MFGYNPELFAWAFHLPELPATVPPVIKMPGQADMSARASTSTSNQQHGKQKLELALHWYRI
jgi:hypothetical protein